MAPSQEETSIVVGWLARYTRRQIVRAIKNVAEKGADEDDIALIIEVFGEDLRRLARVREVLRRADEVHDAS